MTQPSKLTCLRLVISAVLLAATCLAAVHAQTLSFRCNNDLSNVGDSKASVYQKCGEPVFKDSFCKRVSITYGDRVK